MNLDEAIQAWLDGEISDQALKELEQALREQPEVRRRFRELTQFDSTLHEWATARTEASETHWPVAVSHVAPGTTWHARHLAIVLAVVASVALLGAVFAFLWGGNQASRVSQRIEENSAGVAVLTRVSDAEFEGDNTLRVGDTLMAERVKLKRGFVQIEFFSGATVVLEGAAELELRSAWEAACFAGKVRVRVPPPAQGFRLHAPGVKLVDLGTEFGLNVDSQSGTADVHVFEGEVEAHPDHAALRLLKGGESARYTSGAPIHAAAGVNPDTFASIEQFDQQSATRFQQRHDQWWQWTLIERQDPRLLSYYLFKHWANDRWDRLINNFTEPQQPGFAGGAVGAHWTQGRWPMKDALEFKGPGDRVRVNLGTATHQAITMAAWVRVDGVDRKYNALLLTDGYDNGEPHWQIYEDGALMFSIAYADSEKQDRPKARRNQIYYSPPVFTLSNQRRWHHIAVTYESHTGEAVQYMNGREVSREVSPFHVPDRPISFGQAEIGNWGLPTEGHLFPIRNLNGRIDEFAIYKTALSPAEIMTRYEAGKPD